MGLLKGTSIGGVNQITLDTQPVQLKGLLPGTEATDAATVAQLTGGTLDPIFDDVTADSLAITGVVDATAGGAGSINTQGGIYAAKSVYAATSVAAGTSIAATTTVTAGTSFSLGTNIIGLKEVDHVLSITASTTATAVGGKWTITAGTGNTSGNGGAVEINGGVGGATAGSVGGAITITSGISGAGGGASGEVSLISGNGTVSGSINITPGTSSSATVASAIILSNGVVRKPFSTSVASGGTITGPQLLKGLITCTGATGNWQLPTAAQITTALGATPAGTTIEFYVNAAGMTATNTCTLVVGTNMTVMSAPAITGGGTLTVTQDTQVMAKFILLYDSATTCKISRLA